MQCAEVRCMLFCVVFQQSTKLKEQEKANKALVKDKEELQATVRELKARIKEGEADGVQNARDTVAARPGWSFVAGQ